MRDNFRRKVRLTTTSHEEEKPKTEIPEKSKVNICLRDLIQKGHGQYQQWQRNQNSEQGQE